MMGEMHFDSPFKPSPSLLLPALAKTLVRVLGLVTLNEVITKRKRERIGRGKNLLEVVLIHALKRGDGDLPVRGVNKSE
jgi:hypothetical protein